jgi:carboxylate-amine ligase
MDSRLKPPQPSNGLPTASTLREAFDSRRALTVGVEEELMLLDPATRDLAPLSESVLERTAGDPRFKRELPASQIEIVTEPVATVPALELQLREARRDLACLTDGLADLAGCGVHPFAAGEGELNDGPRYRATQAEYGAIARRQLVFALQVHVAPGGAERGLAVYNALRSYLPEIAALAANAPYYEGADTGLASVRPQIAGMLPRQGVPPALSSWEEYEAALAWGARAGTIADPSAWWWELRPHPRFGTLELRVPDTQSTAAEAGAVAAVAQSLVAWLAERFDAGEQLAVHPSWRIAENRWRAARDGVEGRLADLDEGTTAPARERLGELIATLAPVAARLGCGAELERAREMAEGNGAVRQRRIGREQGVRELVDWLCNRFLD